MSSKAATRIARNDGGESTITYRVPAALKAQFIGTLKKHDRNASLVLRDFMRSVVDTDGANIAAPKISDAERQRRKEAVAYGQASVALEGFQVSPDAKQLAQRFVDGDIALNDFASARSTHER